MHGKRPLNPCEAFFWTKKVMFGPFLVSNCCGVLISYYSEHLVHKIFAFQFVPPQTIK